MKTYKAEPEPGVRFPIQLITIDGNQIDCDMIIDQVIVGEYRYAIHLVEVIGKETEQIPRFVQIQSESDKKFTPHEKEYFRHYDIKTQNTSNSLRF